MPKSSVAIGVIGAGIMGERLLTAILQQKPDLLHACGIWDPAPAAMQRMAKTFPQVPRLADAAAIIAASDCVYVASPPASHLGHARAALAAGKSFFGEKPLAVDVADARAFVAEAGDRGAINFPFASSPAVAEIRSWIESGEIGTPRRIEIDDLAQTCDGITMIAKPKCNVGQLRAARWCGEGVNEQCAVRQIWLGNQQRPDKNPAQAVRDENQRRVVP